jgi:hypothetical protein
MRKTPRLSAQMLHSYFSVQEPKVWRIPASGSFFSTAGMP